jgi:LysM domain-containing protein
VPLRIVFAATGPIELWDSGAAVSAHSGETLQGLAASYHVPAWAVAQINRKSEGAALSEGERIVIPRYLGQRIARPTSPDAAKPGAGDEAKPAEGEAATPAASSPSAEH